MFGKCVKHEIRATYRTLIPLCLSTLGVSLVIGLLMILNGRVFAPSESMEGYEIVTTMFTGMMFFVLFAMMISVAAISFVLIIRRFHTSFFTDEGYLSFTLPVTMDQHILSKFVIAMLWTFFAILCALLCGTVIGVGVWIGYGSSMAWLEDIFLLASTGGSLTDLIFYGITGDLGGLSDGVAVLVAVLSVLHSIASVAAVVMSIYFAIAVSSMLVKKNRLILGIAVYWLTNLVFSLIGDGILNALVSGELTADAMMILWVTVSLAWSVIRWFVCYIGTKWIMQKKLNLD